MKIIDLIKKNGFLNLVERVFNRFVPCWIFRFSVMDFFEVDHQKLFESRKNADLVCRHVTDEPELKELRTITFNNLPEEATQNHLGYSVSKKSEQETGSVAGGVWGGVESFPEIDLGFTINLSEDQGWIYCAYIQKEKRGAGMYSNLLSFAVGDMKQKRLSRIFLAVAPWNKRSVAVHKRFAKQKIGRVVTFRLFSVVCIFRSGKISKSKTIATVGNPVELKLVL